MSDPIHIINEAEAKLATRAAWNRYMAVEDARQRAIRGLVLLSILTSSILYFLSK